ncbi:MAG: tRNA (guanosine(46)-N7)-methyltransferase TrmB [Myxococcaceae bacterium]|nr:tRNA (guanosine(46)-N7)-methyltransferase TrmB [Myxococcaceae bacterium]
MSRFPLRPVAAGAEFLGLKEPPHWDTAFGSSGPLELEIGCGAGGFALEYCRRNPHVRYIAFEWRKKFAREVAHRAQVRGLTNLKVIEGDAKLEVPRLFLPGSLAVIHLQFPDPWWKRAHFKRAIVHQDFARFLLTLLTPGGLFDMRTDVEDRAHQMLSILEAVGFHNALGKGVFHPALPEEVPSTRERRYLDTGQPVYRARLTRPGQEQ